MFVYAKILGIFPLKYNRKTGQLKFSVLESAYSVVVNGFILISMPFSIWFVSQNHSVRKNKVFDTALLVQCVLLYLISLTAFIGRLGMQHRSMIILNQHSNLAEILQNTYRQEPKRTFLLIIVSLKCILPVNQIGAVYSLIFGDHHSSHWLVLANCVLLSSYGQLFVIVNTWSLGNISFRLMYDTINEHLSSIFDGLKYQKVTRKQRVNFAPGMILCNDCKLSAAINELADFNSALYLSILRITSLSIKVHLGVLIFQFINNIFGFYLCYNLMQVATATGDFKVVTFSVVTTTWNFVDIFVLFLTCSLVNEGSISEGWKNLYRQFDTAYSNVHLDRSVSWPQI